MHRRTAALVALGANAEAGELHRAGAAELVHRHPYPVELSSDEVWRLTHRLAARVMVAAGLLLLPLDLALPERVVPPVSVAVVLAAHCCCRQRDPTRSGARRSRTRDGADVGGREREMGRHCREP